MVNETSTISERTVLYNTARATLMAFATNNTSTIILMGGGGNGKSHLILSLIHI